MAKVVQPGYFAREDTRTPMRFTLISAAVNIVLCVIVFFTLKSSNYLHVGCAAATTVAGWVNLVLLIRGLRRSGYIELPREFWLKITKMLIASVVMGIVIWFAMEMLYEQLFEGLRALRAFILGLIIIAGVVSYFLVVHVIGAASIKEIKAGFKR